MRRPDAHRPRRWHRLGLATLGLAICWSGSPPPNATAAGAPAVPAAPVTTAVQPASKVAISGLASPVEATLASAVRPTRAIQNAEALPPQSAGVDVAWTSAGRVSLTSPALDRRVLATRILQWSAPYDGTCVAVRWHVDGVTAFAGWGPWRTSNLTPGRCYRWNLTLRDPTGSVFVASSTPTFRAWSSGPAGWYRGEQEHLWFPALGISQSIHQWPCTRDGKLANVVYEWGCAGTNHLYLMGHGYGVFRPLFLGWQHQLKAGQIAWVADANSHLIRYRLAWFVVLLKTDAWATGQWTWAATATSELTLQTCVGATNDRFLFVRFVPG